MACGCGTPLFASSYQQCTAAELGCTDGSADASSTQGFPNPPPCAAQVCTACANSFAHGSNEVANSVGPLAAIYQVGSSAYALNACTTTVLLCVSSAQSARLSTSACPPSS